MRVKEEREKVGLKLNIKKLKIIWSHHSCMSVKSLQACLTLCNPMDYSRPGSSVHGILQAGILEWGAISFSRGSAQPRHQTHETRASYIGSLVLLSLSHQGGPHVHVFSLFRFCLDSFPV